MTTKLANALKKHIADKQFVDIGRGAAEHFSASKENFRTTIGMLKKEGYAERVVTSRQSGSGLESRAIILTHPDFDLDKVPQIIPGLIK